MFTDQYVLSHNTDRNQEQRPGRPFPMNADVRSPPQEKTQPPPVRRVFPAKCVLDLKKLKEMNPSEVVYKLNESMARFKFYLRTPQEQHNSDEFIFDLTCTLATACSAPPDENTTKILAAIKGSVFLSSKIPRLLDRVQVSTALVNQDSQRRLIQCLIRIFRRYLRHLPSSYADIPYHKLKEALDQSSIDGKDDLQEELEAFKQARDYIITAERHQKHGRRYINRTGQKPPNDFRDIPICPTSKEITSQERPFLRKNILKGRYEDAENYLDVQFRLLREDFLEPLREGIYETMHNIPRAQRNQVMKSYQGIRIIGKEFTFSGTIHTAKFDVSKFGSTSWTHSKKLLFGSFLCLSKDNFETMLFATVANRDPEYLEKGIFDLRFIEEQNIFDIEKRQEQYQMVESPAYFEAYRHVLKGLKELDENTLPFKKYLVECCGDVDPPEYLRRKDGYPVYYDLSETLHVLDGTRVPVLDPKAWPPVEFLPLNSSQLEALRTAITTEFSVIQGPPGTGKTYVGTKIVQCLLANRQQWDPENTSPMLMVCYTNHALDQFLEKVLEFLPPKRIIRVGTRCKSKQLQECNLKAFTKELRRTHSHNFIEEKIKDNEKEMKACYKVIAKADEVLLEFQDLEDGMNLQHTDQLYNAVYPRNATSNCQNTPNTFKLWLCNNTKLNDQNQSSITPTKDEDVEGQDGSVLPEDGTGDVLLDDVELLFDVNTDTNHVQSKEPCSDEQCMNYGSKEIPANEITKQDTDRNLTVNSVFLDGSTESDCPNEVLEHTALNASSVNKGKDKGKDKTERKSKRCAWLDIEGRTNQNDKEAQSAEVENSQSKDTGTKQRKRRKKKTNKKIDLTADITSLQSSLQKVTTMPDDEEDGTGEDFHVLDDAELRFDVNTDTNYVQCKVSCPDEQFMNYRPKENSANDITKENTDRNLAANSVFLDGCAEGDRPNEVLDHTVFNALSIDKGKEKTERAHDGNEETITVEGEATRIQNQRFIEGDEEYVSVRLQPGCKGKSQEVKERQTEGGDGGTVEDTEGWTKVPYRQKSNRCVWLDNEGRTNQNDKEAQSAEVENSQSKDTGTKQRKRRKKKTSKKIDLTADITSLQSSLQKATTIPNDEEDGTGEDFHVLDDAELRFDVNTDTNYVQSKVSCPDEQFMNYRPKENSANDIAKENTDPNLTANSVFLDGSAESDCPNQVLGHTAFNALSIDKGKEKTERAHDGNEETITVEGEATRIQNQRFIEGDEEYVSARLQPGYKGKSQEVKERQTEGGDGGTVEDTEGWTKVPYRQKSNRCVWLDNEGRTNQNDRKAKSVKVENSQNKDTGTKKRKKKNKRKKEIDLTADITKLQGQLQKITMMSDDEAMRVENIWFLSANDRLRLYLYWVECYQQRHRIEVQRREQKHEELCAELEWVKGEEEEEFISQATVVGMTTSCAARYHSMLQRIAPKIVIIEEAAEVMEAHIITSLSRSTKHTILIGDHKQLRPKATVYELAQKYNLEISLFERMVMNKMDCKRLCIQHRMRPEIAALTKRIYDHDITDHPSVCQFPDITGLHQNLFFVNHCEPEFLIGGLQSYTNPHEADFLVELCYYLLLQGYRPSQITILTMYTGQLLLLQKKMPKNRFEGVKVCAVDNFQGEENDIVLLSFVRSNSEGRVGFLGESNRICVALSRARQGLYCIGNFSLLKRKCKLWQDICDDLETHNAIGDSLQLVCKNHSNITHVLTSHDFDILGGCKMTCGHRLDCGHACDKPCHALDVYHDPKHEEGQCIKLCFKCCPNEHQCQETCHYPRPCDDCREVMWRTVPQCGHEQPVPCSVDPAKFSCTLKCQKVLKCGHNCSNTCGESCTTQCKVKCIKRLSCKHEKRMACFRDPMLETNCNCNCEKILACGHPCAKKCKEQCQCNTEIVVQLPCEHTRQVLCHKKDSPFQCLERCRRSLDCGHGCPGICHEDCGQKQCKEEVYKALPCGHQQPVPCYLNPKDAFCYAPCERKLKCGHKCSLVCGRLCNEVPCEELCPTKCERGHACQRRCHFGFSCGDCMVAVNKTIPKCKHSIEVPCYIDPASQTCKKPCDSLNVCGHPCRGICSKKCESFPCKEDVNKRLPCGHETTLPCHKNPGKYKCKERITVHLPCGHKQQLLCHFAKANEKKLLCNEKVEKELRCKHKLTLPCHKNPEECKCKKRVDVQLPCGHMKSIVCSVKADLQNVPCMVKIHQKLPCGHEVTLPCYSSREEHFCQEEVQINLSCGHKKLTTCSKMRDELRSETCDTKVTRKLPCGHEKEMKCSDAQEDVVCDLPCDRILPCSHPCPQQCGNDCATFKCAARIQKDLACGFHRVSCLCSDDVSQLVCANNCTKYLPCGHLCPGKCSEDCSEFTCRKMVFKHLDCAGKHSKKMPCSKDPSSVTCKEDCSKNLDCGHPCPGLCSQKCESVRCKRKVEKEFSCGHSASLQCFQRKTATCMAPCRRRKSSCKHICKGICGQDCSNYPCDVTVVKTLLCGHKIQMLCSQSAGDVQCPASCGAKLPCGHQCSGICHVCQQRGSHELCQRPCGRLLVCSHRCKATCSEPCPPCDRKCGRCCPHGKCKKSCSQLCDTCTEPCTWNCPHYQCNNLCGEECDRPRCDAPCPKKLPCRHPCIGLCGENCPTVCSVCRPKKLSSMLADGRGNKTERCLQLFDCGHIIKVDEMDRWMLHELASHDQLRRCPKCSTSITFSYRYGNIIKRSLKSIENVKKKVHEIVYEETTSASVIQSKLRNDVRKLKFPTQVLSAVQWYPSTRKVLDGLSANGRFTLFQFTLKNHLLILQQAQRTDEVLKRAFIGFQLSSQQYVELNELWNDTKHAIEKIKVYLEEPQLDLKILSQVHQQTRKFFLFSQVLEAQSKAMMRQITLSSNGTTRLRLACHHLRVFLKGNDDVLDLEWLRETVNLLRTEVSLPLLPLEEAKDFANFPGYQRDVWKSCDQGHVYFTGWLVRGGEDIPVGSEGCSMCTTNQ